MVEEYKEGLTYDENIRYAVRYGYMYRKDAEDELSSVHYCLPEVSDALLWLGGLVLNGIAWDVIKGIAIKAYNKIVEKNQYVDKYTEDVLTNESELKVFYGYVIEFSDHKMSISEQQRKHVKEEILADYIAKKESEIMKSTGRLPTIEECKMIIKEAISLAESLLTGNK